MIDNYVLKKYFKAKEEAIDVLVVLMRMAVNEGDTEKQHQYALDILNTKSK